jgi:hypothetical protein
MRTGRASAILASMSFKHCLRQNALGLLAVFIALTSSAYAITSLPAGSVGTSQLKNGAVTGKKVGKATLTGANIRSATLGTVANATHASNADHAKSAATPTFARITGALGPGATTFGPVSGLAPADVAADVEQISPHVAITASGLSVRFSAQPLFIGVYTNVTLEVNGADSALTCANGIGHSTTCTDLTHTVTIPPDSTLSFKVGNNTSTEDVSISWIATAGD